MVSQEAKRYYTGKLFLYTRWANTILYTELKAMYNELVFVSKTFIINAMILEGEENHNQLLPFGFTCPSKYLLAQKEH